MPRKIIAAIPALVIVLPSCAEGGSDRQESSTVDGGRVNGTSEKGASGGVMRDSGNKLNSAEIEMLLRGKRISNIGISKPNFMSFYEKFHSSGDWVASFETRGPTEFFGSWRVSEDRVCITPTDREEYCRPISRSPRPESYLIKPYWPSRDVGFVEVEIHEI